jgi:hypothetical protein
MTFKIKRDVLSIKNIGNPIKKPYNKIFRPVASQAAPPYSSEGRDIPKTRSDGYIL